MRKWWFYTAVFGNQVSFVTQKKKKSIENFSGIYNVLLFWSQISFTVINPLLEKLDKNRAFRLYLIFELPNICCSNIFSVVLVLFKPSNLRNSVNILKSSLVQYLWYLNIYRHKKIGLKFGIYWCQPIFTIISIPSRYIYLLTP